MRLGLLFCLLLCWSTTSFAQDSNDFGDFADEYEAATRTWDPLQPLNRVVFRLNDLLYRGVITPTSRGYSLVVPENARAGISRMFRNLGFPRRFVSNVLQGRMTAAGVETRRFFLNSTAGVLGFNDIAQDRYGLQAYDEDLGQVLGAYGMGEIFPITLPVLGPSNVRDTIGWVGDSFLDPVSYLEPWEAAVGVTVWDKVNFVSLHDGEYESLVDSAVDPYLMLRDAYQQAREKEIKE